MILETFGTIFKEEHVKNLKTGILSNTLVLENLGQFPGYYGINIPTQKNPDFIFLVTQKHEPTEKILRITHNIKKKTGINFDGSPAELNIANNNYHAIRLRDFQGFEHISEIQEHYRDEGIRFAKSKKIENSAIIQIKKIFKVETLTDKILKSQEQNIYYLKIDTQLTWSHFKKITNQVRNNIRISPFDAALGILYSSELTDFIRIYSEKITNDELEKLHLKYKEIIKQY